MNESAFNHFPELRSERLLFTDMSLANPGEVFLLRSHPQIYRYIDRTPAQTIDDALQHIELIKKSFADKVSISWLLTDQKTKEVIGYIGIWRFVVESNRTEIGYALKPEYWGKGYMKEAIDVIVRFVFKELQFHSIMADVNPANSQSVRVLEKCGFKLEGHLRENYFFNGVYLDSLIFGLLEKDL